MRNYILCAILLLSVASFPSNEININGYFDAQGTATYSRGTLTGSDELDSSFSIGGNYLFDMDGLKLGPFVNYQIAREVKGASGPTFSYLSFGGMVKYSFNEKGYVFGGVGVNTFSESELMAFYVSNGYSVTSIDTEGGITYFFGVGSKYNEKIALEFLFMNNTGEISINSVSSDVSYMKFSFGMNYTI